MSSEQFQEQIKMNTGELETIKPITTLRGSGVENPAWTPHQNRVYYKKYINQVNQALQSLITAGRLKRMQLMSINNRALFNRGKVQRCEWSIKKHSPTQQSFLPDVDSLNLDTRSTKNRIKNRTKTQGKTLENSRFNYNQQMIDKLIQKQINRIKQQKLLSSGKKQEQIVRQACQAIQQSIINNNNKSKKPSGPTYTLDEVKTQHYKYIMACKDHRRSVTQSVYDHELEQLEKKNNAFLKQKELDKKSFLRRIKHFPSKTK